MALETFGRELFSDEEVSAEKILSQLLSNKNINLKTHILSPVEMAILESYIDEIDKQRVFAKEHGYKQTARFLKNFTLKFKEFMVSWKRLSREEIISALAEIRKEKTGRNFAERLLGMGREKTTQ